MPRGQPTKYKRKFHNDNFLELSKQGKTYKQIAAKWGIARDTLYEWQKVHKEFSDTCKLGRELSEAWYADLGQMAMLEQATIKENGQRKKVKVNLGFFSYLTKNMFGWADRIDTQVNHSGEIAKPNTKTSAEKLARYEELRRKIKEEE